jgi:F0F1-type ATP synthase delta subunit
MTSDNVSNSRKEEIYETLLDIATNDKSQQIKSLRKVIGEDLEPLVNEFFQLIWEYKYLDILTNKTLLSQLEKLVDKYSQEEDT